MPCNCGKNKGTVHFMGQANSNIADPLKWGPILWKILHERPFVEKMVLEEELDWLKEFTNWIPCGECSVHWKQFVRNNQPDLSSVKAYFDWTVKAHNDVNKKLGKPIWQE